MNYEHKRLNICESDDSHDYLYYDDKLTDNEQPILVYANRCRKYKSFDSSDAKCRNDKELFIKKSKPDNYLIIMCAEGSADNIFECALCIINRNNVIIDLTDIVKNITIFTEVEQYCKQILNSDDVPKGAYVISEFRIDENGTLLKFNNTKDVYTLVIPNNIKCIGTNACASSDIRHVSIPNTVSNIDDYAFHLCKQLVDVNVLGSIKSIGYGAFMNCDSLTTAVLNEGVVDIGNCVFSEDTNLKSIKLPNSLTSIGEYAFYNCKNLQTVKIPNNIIKLEDGTFNGCRSINNIYLSKSLKYIGYGAFYKCTSLKTVYYSGSADEWSNIIIDDHNTNLTKANIIFNSMSDVSESTTANSNSLIIYHSSNNKNLSIPLDFNKSREIGLHCGSLEQAIEKGNKYIFELNIKSNFKCLHLTEDCIYLFSDLKFAEVLLNASVIDSVGYSQLVKTLRSHAADTNKDFAYSKIYRELLLNRDYVALDYPNDIEGEGKSICIFDNSIINSMSFYMNNESVVKPKIRLVKESGVYKFKANK